MRSTSGSEWIKKHKESGSKGLKANKRGVKSEDKKLLRAQQEVQTQKMIIDTMPDQLKLDFTLYTRKAEKELVEQEFGIIVAISTMVDYLHKWGFSPQKPKKRSYKQSDKAVKNWLDVEFPAIKLRTKTEDAEIHCGDEIGIKNNCNHGRSYPSKGQTTVKLTCLSDFR